MNINLKHKGLMFLSAGSSTALFFMYHLKHAEAFAYAGIFAMLVPVLLFDLTEAVCVLIYYITQIRMFTFIGGASCVGYLIIVIFCKHILIRPQNLRTETLFAALIMIGVLVANIVVTKSTSLLNPFIRFAMGFMTLTSYFAMTDEDKLRKDYEYIKTAYVLGCCSLVILGLLFNAVGGTSFKMDRFYGIHSDPNVISMTLGTGFSFILIDMISSKKTNIKWMLAALIILFGGMITVSRGYLIAVSVNILLVIYLFTANKNISAMYKILALVLIVTLIIFFKDRIGDIIKMFSERFNDESFETGNGRVEIEGNFLSLWRESFAKVMFGIGSAGRLYNIGLSDAVHHNYYIELLTSIGIAGVAAMLNIYRVFVRAVFKDGFRFRIMLFFPLITYAILLMGLAGLFSDSHIGTLFMCFMQYKIYMNNGKVLA